MKWLAELEFLDLEKFKSNSGGKSKKSPNQMSGEKTRNLLVEFESSILPYLTEKGKSIEQ